MAAIWVDTSGFQAAHQTGPDLKSQALWTFRILDHSVNFWGRYPEAVSTAEQYARQHGVTSGAIRLEDCSGTWQGMTRH